MLKWREATDGPLVALAIGSIPLVFLELKRSELIPADVRAIDYFNLIVLVCFAIDYFVELAICSNRKKFVRHEWTSAVIVISSAIAFIPGLSGLRIL